MDKVEADIADKQVEHMVDVTVDVDQAVVGVEEGVHLLRQHRTTIYLWLVVRLPHSLVEEQDHSMPRTLLNVSIIGIIVSHAALTLKMDIHLQHAHRIGKNLVTKRDATDRMYSST